MLQYNMGYRSIITNYCTCSAFFVCTSQLILIMFMIDIMSVVAINNCADLTITTEKLNEQFASLDPEKVDELGGWLGLSESEFDNIKSSYDSPMQRKEAYLDLYVHQHPCPSWARIAYTLRELGLRQQADFVENTYVKGTQDTSSSVVSN